MATPDDEAFLKKYGNYKPAAASVPVSTIKPIIGGETPEEAAARRAEEVRKARTGEISEVTAARAGREEIRTSANQLRDEFNGLEPVKDYKKALPNYAAALKTQDTGTGDLALVYYFAKTIDPGSAVQQGEMDNIQTTDARLPTLAQRALRELQISNGNFTKEAREGLRRELRGIIDQRKSAYLDERDRYMQIAKSPEYNVSTNIVVGETPFGERYNAEIESYWKDKEPAPAPGGAPVPAVAPIEAGKPFQTEADIAAQRQLQDAWNRGLSVDEIIQLNQQIGRGAFLPEDIQRLRDARQKGEQIQFYGSPSGQPTAAEGLIGAALSTPVGEAVGGYALGAANALTAGTLDELAPILGLDPGRVQAAKDYLRERAPTSSLVGEVTGGVLGSIPAVRGASAALAGTRLAGAAPLLGEIAYGAGYGAGEAPTGERLTGALIGGGAAGIGGALANRFLPGGPGTFTGMAPEVPAGAMVPEMPPVAAMAPEAPPVAAMAPEAPPMAAQAAPAPTPEAAAVVPGTPATTEEMITLAQKSVSRAPGASKARAQLAEIAKTNPEAKAAADRLGIELPVDVLSDNAQLKEVTGLTRSQIGSEAKQAWNETVSAVSDRAHQAMDELDAVTDISQVSADVFDRLDKAQMGLGRQASDLRQEVTDAVDVRGRVDATGIKSWLQRRIDDLGGGKEGIAALSPEEKRLWGIVSKGQPTYALLNEQRDLIGQALEKGTGPWSNTNMKRLKDIYGSLADDQINFIEASAGKEIADKQRAANTLFKQMYDGREQMEKIFTKNLSGGLAPLMQRAITQGTKGNAQTLNTLVKIIPEDMRGKVLTSALFKAAKTTDDTFSFTNFANIYRDLRANGAIYKEFAKAVGPEGDKLMTDLYAISRRLSDADKAISRTGASTQLQLLNSERLLSRILMASGGAAGAGLIGSMLGGPGAAIVGAGLAAAAPEIAQRVGKTNAQKLHNLMSSNEFRELATSAATGDALDRNINRVAGSGAFRDFAKVAGIELKQGRNWLRSAITAGTVGEVGPEAGPPEGAIMVRPQ